MPTRLNDVHSKLNPSDAARLVLARDEDDVRRALCAATRDGLPLAVCGGRHAMGGQQFADGGIVVDASGLDRILAFDPVAGTVTVEAGIEWPALVESLHALQVGAPRVWSIRQKQTGADRFSLGGSVSANVHGRGLTLPPLGEDVLALRLLLPGGEIVDASRERHADLFRLAVGGYGLFGIVLTVTLRLVPRVKLERTVEIRRSEELPELFARRIADGYAYGDFQFSCDERSPDFLSRGVFSCYRELPPDAPMPEAQRQLSGDDWQALLRLAHAAKSEAFRRYADYYLATSGQRYWSDTHQLSYYLDDYHPALDRALGARCAGSEMITELYVPRQALEPFLADARRTLRATEADVIYGTIRLIERDRTSFLPWASEPWACVVLNLHTDHHPAGIERTRRSMVALIDAAIAHRGSFYLTYHRWARRDQLLACYPQLPAFFALKRRLDPDGLLQSDWYRAVEPLVVRGTDEETRRA